MAKAIPSILAIPAHRHLPRTAQRSTWCPLPTPEGPFPHRGRLRAQRSALLPRPLPCIAADMGPITWARIRWPEGRRDQAHLVCEACGGIHHEHEKPRLLAAGGNGVRRPRANGRIRGLPTSPRSNRRGRPGPRSPAEHGRVRKGPPPRLTGHGSTPSWARSWEDQAGDTRSGRPAHGPARGLGRGVARLPSPC